MHSGSVKTLQNPEKYRASSSGNGWIDGWLDGHYKTDIIFLLMKIQFQIWMSPKIGNLMCIALAADEVRRLFDPYVINTVIFL